MRKILVFLIFLCFVPSAHSFGLASSYLKNRTMLLYPGESRDYTVEIQNNAESEMRFSLKLNSDIARLIEPRDFYMVGGENKIIPVAIKITVPTKAKINQEFSVHYTLSPVSESGGQIGINIEFSDQFKVVVVEKPVVAPITPPPKKFPYITVFSIILSIIALIVVIILVFKKNKRLSERIFQR